MADLEPAPWTQSTAADLSVTPVDEAIRAQLIIDIGHDRLENLHRNVDRATFNEVLHWLSSHKRGSLETKRGYTEDITRIARWYTMTTRQYPASLLTGLDFDTMTKWSLYAKSQGWAVRTQRRYLSALSSLFKFARRVHRLPVVNPVSMEAHAPPVGTSTNGRPPGAVRVLDVDQVAAIQAACQTDEEHLVFELLYVHGLRESEICALDVDNIDRSRIPPIVKFQRKGSRWVERQLTEPGVRRLDAYLDGRDTGPLLIDPDTGQRRHRHQIIPITRRLARHAEVSNPAKVTPHVLRGSAITALLDQGKPLQEVQEWADHRHATTTRGYWERRNNLRRDAALSAALLAELAETNAGITRPQEDQE
ncbi:tyrosine-type recombinase/integrase [Saccharopolyspora sp. K220]|uniref:tyrosine-type recombinase/integrase n=1 Tax=Saccharopolyspora soli TaxID=2926618 RepID=UPI001F57F9BC|nr:tyrosine-type recombinase/integrase [Saccharopolyspora soli]MCI2421101.1 tyrosine-type recombinase/integrase [Saccharopolyspora soli]